MTNRLKRGEFNMKKFKTIAAVTLVVTLLFSLSAFANAAEVTTDEDASNNGRRMGGFKLDIDEDTQEVLDTMKEDGATREEITEYLTEQGYEMPEKAEGEKGGKSGKGQKLDIDEDTQAVIDTMKEDGATREEITEYLTEQGYEMPEKAEGERGGKGGKGKLDIDEDTQEGVDTMKEDGATREEITEYLIEQGYEMPEKSAMKRGGKSVAE
jgi:DNA-binding transcriptional regulator YhcF (GntR family)